MNFNKAKSNIKCKHTIGELRTEPPFFFNQNQLLDRKLCNPNRVKMRGKISDGKCKIFMANPIDGAFLKK